jgi:hypothetical protein
MPRHASTIKEADEIYEQTGNQVYQEYVQPQQLKKTRQQEWEEAVELDRQLEKEREHQARQRF